MQDIEYLECRCHSPEHTLRLWFDDDESHPCVYASIFLGSDPWYERVWNALKYVFGYKCRYGHFDEFLLRPEDCDRLIAIAERLKKAAAHDTSSFSALTDLEEFFRDLERQYIREKQDFVWSWEGIREIAESKSLPPGVDMLSDYVCFIAYNLAKNILHGRLPDPLHARMMFYRSDWVRKYVEHFSR